MKIGLLGSGAVGQALAKGFISEGHSVWLATREPSGDKANKLKVDIPGAVICDFATAARESELAVLCVKWDGAEAAVAAASPENLAGKTVIDASNIISKDNDTMVYGGTTESAAQQVQRWLPESSVVKAFNTVGAAMMYKPDFGGTMPTMFIAGDDAAAKQQVSEIVAMFGWEALDTGSLIAARELEAMALVWIRYSIASGDAHHAFKML